MVEFLLTSENASMSVMQAKYPVPKRCPKYNYISQPPTQRYQAIPKGT
jgi:hypothetical protein